MEGLYHLIKLPALAHIAKAGAQEVWSRYCIIRNEAVRLLTPSRHPTRELSKLIVSDPGNMHHTLL